MALLIQGFFFQPRTSLGIVHQSESLGGSRAIIREDMCDYMFAGIIFPDSIDQEGTLTGNLYDSFGDSVIIVTLTETELRFTKKYEDRPDVIEYQFHREGSLWVGGYSGKMTGTGKARCIITEVPDQMFIME